MNRIGQILLFFWACIAIDMYGQNFSVDDILEDIYNQLAEEDEILQEDLQEQLMEIAAHPIDFNHTNADELSRLLFLSDEQIDAILLYQYKHPFQDLYELQLIDCLKDYDIRNMLPFVYVGDVKKEEKLYFREIFHYANHEITLRTDARNLEDFDGDPMYAKLRYRFNYRNQVQAGMTVGRGTGVAWQDVDYGGYIELRDIGPMKRIVAGNYQANFGYGLVVGSPFKRGKSAYIQSTTKTDEGIKKYSSVGDSYTYFHGLGATAKVCKWAEVTSFYSIKQDKDKEWNHIVGVNMTARWNKLKVGISGIENIKVNTNQAVIGLNARYNMGKVDLWGEVATSQGNQWGVAGIAGVRYTPISEVNLLAIYRYYSPSYNNLYANALCSHSKIKDEHGGYLGIEYNRLKNWQLSAFGDVWKNGYESIVQGEWIGKQKFNMTIRGRAKRKDDIDTYSLRWYGRWQIGAWKLKTQLDVNMVYAKNEWSYGWSVLQDVEYRFAELPIVLQFRAQAFDAQQWNNRIYTYEHDVLYAYAIPFVYGLGGRFLLNARYHINDRFALYVRVSETIYQNKWATAHDKKSTRTDVHALLRVKL